MGKGLTFRRGAVTACALALTATTAGVVAAGDEPAPQFCTADGLIGDDGEIYGRDPDQGCRFVDQFGRVLSGE